MDDYYFTMDSLIEEYNDLISRKGKGENVGNELDKVKYCIHTVMFYGHQWLKIKKMQQRRYKNAYK